MRMREGGGLLQVVACFLGLLLLAPAWSAVTLQVECNKIYLRPGATQFATVTAKNDGADATTVKVATTLRWDLTASRPLGEATLTVPVGGSAQTTFTFPAGPEPFGYEVRAEAVGVPEVAPASALFSVHDNFWQVTVQGGLHIHAAGNPGYPAAFIENVPKACHTSLSNHMEFFAWAPDDFSTLMPETEYWAAGQTLYPGSKFAFHNVIDSIHDVGGTVSAYAKGQMGGTAMMEFFRRHPAWVMGPYHGQWDELSMKQFDTISPLTNGGGNWPRGMCDIGSWPLANWHIQQLKEASNYFRFDGVRYDDHLAVGWLGEKNKPVNERNMEQIIVQLRAALPYYGFGFNWITGGAFKSAWEKHVPPTDDWVIAGAAGPQVMDEEVGQIFGSSHPKGGLPWADYLKRLHFDRDLTEPYGGKVFIMQNMGLPATDSAYRNALVFASRLHHTNYDSGAPGQYARFATRYGALIWHDNPLEIPPDQVQVKADRPVWAGDFAYRYQLSPTTGRVIIHLINPPLNANMWADPKAAFPDPLANVGIHCPLPDGWQATRAVLIDADTLQQMTKPLAGAAIDITVPTVKVWSVLAVDCQVAK